MEATLTLPQLDLAPDIIDKLAARAAEAGNSLKVFLENTLTAMANGKAEVKSESPSPSGDPWWNDPHNVAVVEAGIASMKTSKPIPWESIKAKYEV